MHHKVVSVKLLQMAKDFFTNNAFCLMILKMVWMVATDLIPELKTKKAVTVCDDEFQGLMKKMMPASHHAACEVCTCSLFA